MLTIGGAALSWACSSDVGPGETGQAHQALTSDQSRVLGFENPSADWSTNNGTPLALSDERVQGQGSLGIQLSGYTVITSRQISAPGAASEEVSFAVRLPVSVPWGEARLILEAPSQGIYWRDLGGRPLTGLVANQFHRLSFSVPSDAQAALASTAGDLSFKVVLNGPGGVGQFLVDDLQVGVEQGPIEEGEEDVESFTLALPSGTSASEVVLGGEEGVHVAARCTVGDADTGPLVVGFTPNGVAIGADATVEGSIRSTRDVFLSSNATVNGDVVTSRDIIEQNDVTVTGARRKGSAVRPAETGWEVTWPRQNNGPLSLPPDAPNREVVAGSYGDVQVFSRATLTFRTGTYFLNSLVVEPQARVRVDSSNGPVVIYVREALRLNVSLDYLSHQGDAVVFGYLGTSPAVFQEAIVATVVAPNSVVDLRRPNGGRPHQGSFFGKSVHVHSDARVEHIPFSLDSVCLSGTANGNRCIGEPGSPSEFTSSLILLPKGVELTQMAVGAAKSLRVGANSEVSGSEQLVTVAEGQVEVDAGGMVPGIVAVAGASVGAAAVVDGDVRTDGPVSLAQGGTVTGSVNDQAGLSPVVSYSLSRVFNPPVNGDVLVVSGRSKILVPGSYGTVRVESGGTIYLRSGDYAATDLAIASGASVIVMPDAGWVMFGVSRRLAVHGVVSGIGNGEALLGLIYAGISPAEIGGQFNGAVLAPSSSLSLSAGPHQGTFYASDLAIAPGTRVSHAEFPWVKVVATPEEPDDVTVPPSGLPASLRASSIAPGHVSKSSGFDFTVPGRIPVSLGNAGNGSATLGITLDGGSQITCSYAGGASTMSPTTLLEIARGREYALQECTGGVAAGDVVRATDVSLELTGDPTHPAGKTTVNVPLEKGCEGDLVPPISLAESRELIESFEWPLGVYPHFQDGLLPETVNGESSLFYAQIYITDRDELELLDRLLIHWEKSQIFQEEWPADWENVCGKLHYDHDGEGVWVWAALTGAMYNAILRARIEPLIPEDQRELFRAIRILEPPSYLATAEGSFDLEALSEYGFEYRGLTGVPDAIALQEALFPGGKVAQAIADAAKWVWDKAKQALQGIARALSFFDKIYGTVSVTVDVDVLNGDPTFPEGSLMQRAWGEGSGNAIAPQGAKVNLWTSAVRLTSPIPFSRLNTDRMSVSGYASMKVARECPNSGLCGQVNFKRLCIELENDAGYVTTFLGASSVCDRTLSENDFNRFQEASHHEWIVDDRDTRHLTEVTDSYEYLRQIVGEEAKQARVTVGPNATLLSGFDDNNAAALCLGFGDLAADIVAPVGGPYLTILANTDILITDNSYAKDTRGLMTHEYGHFALCDLVRKNGDRLTADFVLTLDSIAAGGGDPDPDEEARVVNEAFADFFAIQIAGGVNYSWLRDDVDGILPAANGGFYFSVDLPGADADIFDYGNRDNNLAVGRLAGLMQDLFDGRPFTNDGPNSGDPWILDPTDSQRVMHRTGVGPCLPGRPSPECRLGDVDLEQVMLGGATIKTAIKNFQKARKALGGYRAHAMEEGMIKTALDGSNWCQACLLAAPHFSGFVANPASSHDNPFARDLITACKSGLLADHLGPPPRDTREMDAFSCEPCPPGTGMGREGHCVTCPVDVQLVWNGDSCSTQTAEFSSDPAVDFCPESFLVEIVDSGGGAPVSAIGISVASYLEEPLCSLSRLSGEVSRISGTLGTEQLLAFDTMGEVCVPDPGSDVCLHVCDYPTSDEFEGGVDHIQLAVTGSRFLVTAQAGIHGVNVSAMNRSPGCGPVVK